MVDAKDVMKLRSTTGAGVNDCKSALTESGGDLEKAKDLLRKRGMKIAEKKSSRATSSGLIGTYLHPTPDTARVGVMVQFNCETDFVARNEDFQAFVRQVCQHVAATAPKYVDRTEVPEDIIAREKEIFADQVKDKPPAAMEKIVEGKLEKFFEQNCLIDQPFILDTDKTVGQMVMEKIATIGENMKIASFARFEVGT